MKRVLLILTAIMLVFAVAGCNSNGAPTTVVERGQGGNTGGGDEGGGDEGGGTGGGETPSTPTVVWEPAITSSTPINGGTEYIGNFGIQAGDKANTTFTTIAGGFTIAVTGGSYKPIIIQTGTAVGGTDHYASSGFIATADTDYTITFMASVDVGTGQIRLAGNGSSLDSGTSVSIDTTPKSVTCSWKQTATGGNFKFDTGSTPITSIITITGLKITTP